MPSDAAKAGTRNAGGEMLVSWITHTASSHSAGWAWACAWAFGALGLCMMFLPLRWLLRLERLGPVLSELLRQRAIIVYRVFGFICLCIALCCVLARVLG